MGCLRICSFLCVLIPILVLFVPLLVIGPPELKEGALNNKPILLPSNAKWSKVQLKSGIKLNTITVGTPLKGKMILFLHGFPESGMVSWHKQLNHFGTKHGESYFLVAPDIRGYNTSDKPEEVSSYGINSLANDVVDLIEYFKYEKAYVVAHDWGGALGWAAAIKYPERIEKYVVINMPHLDAMAQQLRGKKFNPTQIMKSWYIFYFQIPFFPEIALKKLTPIVIAESATHGAFSKAEIAALEKSWNETNALTSMLNYYRATLRYPFNPENMRVKVPVKILWGVKDHALNPTLPEDSLSYCDNASIVYLNESTHWVVHDDSERVNLELEKFFDK